MLLYFVIHLWTFFISTISVQVSIFSNKWFSKSFKFCSIEAPNQYLKPLCKYNISVVWRQYNKKKYVCLLHFASKIGYYKVQSIE